MSLEYEGKGETFLTVGKYLDGSALLVVTNYGWSAKKDEKYDLRFVIDAQEFGGGKSIGVDESNGRKGFATRFGSDFFPSLAGGAGFKIYMGDTLVDSLTLKGSSAAVAMVDRCLTAMRAVNAAEEHERQRFAHIPDDPFAGAPSAPIAAKGDASQWVTNDDYPSDALSAEAHGRVSVKYDVGPSGRVENCTVVSSSGNASLDRATCSALTRRGRYTPQLGPDGSAIRVTKEFSFDWKLPE